MKKYIIDDFGFTGDYTDKIMAIKRCGFDGVFLNMRQNKMPLPVSIMTKKIDVVKKCSMDIVFIHLPVEPDYNTMWTKNYKDYVNVIVNYIKLFSSYGIKNFVMHSYYKNIPIQINDNIIKSFSDIKSLTKNCNVNIYIENVDYYFQDEYVFENLKNDYMICYDIGHENAFYTDEQKDYLTNNFSFNIKMLHLHDNNGKTDEHKIPFSDGCSVDFYKLKKISSIKDIPLTLECKMEKTDDITLAEDFLKKAFLSAEKIEKIING